MEIAAAKALIDVGITDLKSVFYAASLFAQERVPSCPFNKGAGITLLVVGQGWARDVFLSPTDSGLELYTRINQCGAIGATIINMSEVFDRTVTAIGLHPEAVLEIAYPEAARA